MGKSRAKSTGFLLEEGPMLRFNMSDHFLTEDYITHSLVECFTPAPAGSVAREIAGNRVSILDRTVLRAGSCCIKSLGTGSAGLGGGALLQLPFALGGIVAGTAPDTPCGAVKTHSPSVHRLRLCRSRQVRYREATRMVLTHPCYPWCVLPQSSPGA